ncbi:WD-40 repeat protein [Reticulomyxa filosa]|uniref:WD-40 repeat protein n=1 Tax=Reticulomyxa filosa TaxID=46433 RepID=X6MLY8_RETFI|nr:WD-40 repeat protein [Reticulomyxa filosa]|eukprot:ETO14671.1 WD-40 repeat protein [Reticulomyxa filosa]
MPNIFTKSSFLFFEKANCLYVIFLFIIVSQLVEEDIQLILQHWIRILNIKLGWIHEFDKLVIDYVKFSLFNLNQNIQLFLSVDYSTFDDCHFIYSGSADSTVCVWDIDNNKQIRIFDKHSTSVNCVKFSQYYYHNNRRKIICSSSWDNTIRFWDIEDNKLFQIFNRSSGVSGIEFSPFHGGRYLCSGSDDNTICLWDIETSKSLHVFNGHENIVWCVDISPLQSNNKNDNKTNDIGIIGGNGYTICSGSNDNTIRIWDIETTIQLITFKGHEGYLMSVKYGSNELLNTILSGSEDKSVRLWDIRSGQQIQMFNGHTDCINTVEYSPFIIKNSIGNSNVICSGSCDNTIRFWDIRLNKNELHVINGDSKDNEIRCIKLLQLKNNNKHISLCYGSYNGLVHIWG